MDMTYYRPLVQVDVARPGGAHPLAGGWGWFTHIELLSRSAPARIVPASKIPDTAFARLVTPRAALVGLPLDRPRLMGILNTTPDSFSDGGQHETVEAAVSGGKGLIDAGADMLDIGGESTRPGAATVLADTEIGRTAPVISGLRKAGVTAPISIDTRKAVVARAALEAGADLINDVSGFTFDDALAPFAAASGAPVCVMHALGDPQTMQANPRYDNVLLDVYDFLKTQIARLTDLGVPPERILADPGIGFGKTLAHNLTLLARISLFHSLGVPLLLGASRKRFIGTIGNAPDLESRAPGSIAVALTGIAQGVQMVRVHDIGQTVQAVALWRASVAGSYDD